MAGLRARGDFEVGLLWEDGNLTEVRLKSGKGGPCTVRYGEKRVDLQTHPAHVLRLNGELAAIE